MGITTWRIWIRRDCTRRLRGAYRRHQSLPEIHRSLHEQGLSIGERTVLNLLARYEELVTMHITDRERLQSLVQKQGHLILAVDGLRPDVGHEVRMAWYAIVPPVKFCLPDLCSANARLTS
jgi:hypothetical protein